MHRYLNAILLAASLGTGMPVIAQVTDTKQVASSGQDDPFVLQSQQTVAAPVSVGHVATSSVGDVGQRQTREQAAPGMKSTGRIASRIQSRVQSRIRNRIDRGYDPQANATNPFAVAGNQARVAGKPGR